MFDEDRLCLGDVGGVNIEASDVFSLMLKIAFVGVTGVTGGVLSARVSEGLLKDAILRVRLLKAARS
jgi:hypothetical protein